MIKEIEIKVDLDFINDDEHIKNKLAQKIGINSEDIDAFIVIKKSIDARSKFPFFLLRVNVYIAELPKDEEPFHKNYKSVTNKPQVIIVGAGPAGYFAALELIELGYKPVVLDRGKDVQARRRDLRAIQQEGIVNPDSNYCFGEGGAGTYSDGKLYTRSHKRGVIYKVLKQLVDHGASPEILIDAHPHIGSNKLPQIIANIRKTIEDFGGEIHFVSKVTDIIIENKIAKGVSLENGKEYIGDAVILATGHSARDIYYLLDKKHISIEAKPFALGVRIEHSQSFIDNNQYKQNPRHENLPAASYKVVCQIMGNGVYSFCMCPGGLVVPASTAPGEIVVNGMSLSRRDSAFANSGFVTSVELQELEKYGYKGKFAALNFQQEVEQKMFSLGDGTQKAPAQRVSDFVNGKLSKDLFDTSYIPGLISSPLHDELPYHISERLRKGIKEIDKQLKGYLTYEANIIATESRTSSPIKIPRNAETMMHIEILNLYPCGEGAGYAGGILSAAMDGQNVARAIVENS